MKKIMIFAAFAAVLSLASCQKEMDVEKDSLTSVESPVFTAEISEGSKTTLDAANGKVSWDETDEITVTDNASNSAVYKIKSIDGTTGKATFIIEDGSLGDGPYTATYGTAPAISQVYSANPGKLYMTAPATSSNSFTFDVQCGLLEINLTKAGTSIKSVSMTGTPTGGSETTYTLTCSTAQSIAAKKSFYIAVPAGTYTKIVIKDSNNDYCILKSSGIAVATNHIKPLTITSSKLAFRPIIPGEFSVSATKKVNFSKGNLQAKYNGSSYTWGFAANQYDYIGETSGNTTIDSQTSGKVVDLFGWSTSATNYGINTAVKNTAYSGSFRDWGTAINSGTWRTLSNAEWTYLLNERSASTVSGVPNARYAKATVNSKAGIILLPDSYTHPAGVTALTNTSINAAAADFINSYAGDNWTKLESAGAVFLPAAGSRTGSALNYVGSRGFYWSSTAESDTAAYETFLSNNRLSVTNYLGRYISISVRLVTDVQ